MIPETQDNDDDLSDENSVEIIDNSKDEECIIITSDEQNDEENSYVIFISNSDETYFEDLENMESQEESVSQTQSLLMCYSYK